MMDEDLERIVFVANLGMIPPLESVSIFISTSSELQTLPSGVVRVLLPAVCVPRVPQPGLENASSFSSHQPQMYGKPRGGLCLGLILVNAGLAEQELQVAGEWLQALPLADLQFLGGRTRSQGLLGFISLAGTSSSVDLGAWSKGAGSAWLSC